MIFYSDAVLIAGACAKISNSVGFNESEYWKTRTLEVLNLVKLNLVN